MLCLCVLCHFRRTEKQLARLLSLNPYMLVVYQHSLVLLVIFISMKHLSENVPGRNVYQNPINNSPSNGLLNHISFVSYSQKHRLSRRSCFKASFNVLSSDLGHAQCIGEPNDDLSTGQCYAIVTSHVHLISPYTGNNALIYLQIERNFN